MDNCNAEDNCQRENRIMRDINIHTNWEIYKQFARICIYVYVYVRERKRENIVKQNLAFESLLVEAILGFRTVSKNVPVEGILSAYQLRMQ